MATPYIRTNGTTPQIDFGTSEALTTYGIIGVKVWIFRGEKIEGIDATEVVAS